MTNNSISVPRKLEGKEFPEDGVAKRLDKALKETEDAGYEAQFMPELIDTRIASPNNSRPWRVWWTTLSIRATGRTKQGNPVVVYAHVPHYFSNADNITKAIEKGLVNYAGQVPKKEFQVLLDLEDNERVFVVDYNILKQSSSGVIPVSKALKHPQTIPFLAGKERAESYLERHKEVYGENIGNWYSDDLSDEPLARLLHVGYYYYDGLFGYYDLDYNGRFLGVKRAGEASAPRILAPNSEQLERVIGEYIAPRLQDEVKERVSALFR